MIYYILKTSKEIFYNSGKHLAVYNIFLRLFMKGLIMPTQRIVVAITGATGAIYGVRLLEALNSCSVEVHVVVSNWGIKTLELETNYTLDKIKELSHCFYDYKNVGAAIASGSFRTQGMVIIPCSMKTLSAISHGITDNLIVRAADVALKERRKLILVPRETPLNKIHLDNMQKASSAGAYIVPPMPAFYYKPKSIGDIVNHFVGRILDLFNLQHNLCKRWGEHEDCLFD